jgi:prepilin-type N-terminal cleavage/methylation domain-containing protein
MNVGQSRFTNSVRSQDGMSLIEILIVVALLGVVSLGVAQLITSMNRQITYAKMRTDAAQLQASIEDALRIAVSCTGNMTLPAPNDVSIPNKLDLTKMDYYDSTGTAVYSVVPALNTTIPDTQLTVVAMRLVPISGGAWSPISVTGTNRYYSGNLSIQFGVPAGYSPLAPRLTRAIMLTTDLAGNVTACGLAGTDTCVQGFRNKSKGTAGTVDPALNSQFNTIFTQTTSGTAWGLICNPGHMMNGCTSSDLATPGGGTTATVTLLPNGCEAPNSAALPAGRDSTLYLGCCAR